MRAPIVLLALVSTACGVSLSQNRALGDRSTTIHRFQLSISNVYAIESPDGAVLVDTGDPGQDGEVLRALVAAEVPRDRVRLIVVTHAHADHTGGAPALARALDAPIALQRGDVATAARGHNPPLHATSATASLLELVLTQDFEAYTPTLAYDDCLDLRPYGVAGVVRSAPGHTPGSSVVILDGGDAIVGDLVAGGYLGGIIAPDVPTEHYFQDHPRQVRAVLEWLLEEGVTRFFLGHGGPTNATRLRTALEAGELGPPPDAPFRPAPCAL
ncbi:MAG: MBL fold metallo-hydrolase [Sandaracinaceae bacterium]|nr:MBL fold metallo-hydrolase [Sandaracinaceae bacterium]